MYLLNQWYLDVCSKLEQWLLARVKQEHYFNGDEIIHVEFNVLHQLFYQEALDNLS